MPVEVDLVAAELPGRGTRFGEPCIGDLTVLVKAMADNFHTIADLPLVFFGHSLGALVCFELTRELRRRGLSQPKMLIAAGKNPPHFPPDERLHDLPDGPLIDALQNYEGTPESALKNQELMQIVLPILRADFALNETRQHRSEAPFDFPVTALGGDSDGGVKEQNLMLWGEHTCAEFQHVMFSGGHFFPFESPSKEQTVTQIQQILKKVMATPQPALS